MKVSSIFGDQYFDDAACDSKYVRLPLLTLASDCPRGFFESGESDVTVGSFSRLSSVSWVTIHVLRWLRVAFFPNAAR